MSYCIATDGDAGGSDHSITRAEMAAIRREEQLEAARAVGVTDVTFLGFPDGRVTADLELRAAISRVIRLVRPDRVVCQSPERNWERIYASHPDHLATGEAAACAVYPDARNPFAFPELLDEGLEPHTVPELWVMATERANRVVDATDVYDRKLTALKSHRSQVGDGRAPRRTPARLDDRHRSGRRPTRGPAGRGVPRGQHGLVAGPRRTPPRPPLGRPPARRPTRARAPSPTVLAERRCVGRRGPPRPGRALPAVGGRGRPGGAWVVPWGSTTTMPWLAPERDLLAAAVDAGLPVLGVCLGAQQLAAALGAEVTDGPEEEVGPG